MSTPDAAILTIRALNETRLLHPPTYVGGRYLADSIVSDRRSSLAIDAITRKYPLQVDGRFHCFQRFKKIGEQGRPEYREFVISSPWTALVEAVVIATLTEAVSFRKPSNVFSYLKTKHSRCPYNYEHYFNGYQARNRDVTAHLITNPRHVALVADVERFYPSIRHDRLLPKFRGCLEASGARPAIAETAKQLVKHLLAAFPQGVGIPTGPALSPLLADVYLAKADSVLIEKFGNRYFRYVDDFVFLLDPSEVKETQAFLKELLSAEGLRTNPAKDDVVSSDVWLSQGPKGAIRVSEYSFEALVFKIKAFLSSHPDGASALQSAFMNAGFNLPLGRMAVNAQRVGFLKRLSYLTRKLSITHISGAGR